MRRVAIYSFLVGTGVLAITLVMISISVPLLGDTYQKTMIVNSVVGCYGLGTPVTYFCLRQGEQLKVANRELIRIQEELALAHADLVEKVRHDQLTGLLNREFLFEMHREVREHGHSHAVLIIDADHFKAINDEFGHFAGDEALRMISDAIGTAVRDDDVVGRIGGEEFGVLLPGATALEARRVAERVCRKVEALRFVPQGSKRRIALTVSIGGISGQSSEALSSMLASADRNMYAAKNAGRNRAVIGDRFQDLAA
ncbi:MAG: GGDEF domain-containing protein [Rhizobiaceae bacterium]